MECKVNLIAPVLLVPMVMLMTLISGKFQLRTIQQADNAAEEQYAYPKSYKEAPFPVVGWNDSQQAFDNIVGQLDSNIVIGASEYGMLGNKYDDRRLICFVGLHNIDMAMGGCMPETLNAILQKEEIDFIWMPHIDYTQL